LAIYSQARDCEIRLTTNSGTANNAYVTLRQSGGNLDLYSTNGAITLNPANTERLRITSAGLVGIGTSAPLLTAHIEVPGSGTSDAAAVLIKNASTNYGRAELQLRSHNDYGRVTLVGGAEGAGAGNGSFNLKVWDNSGISNTYIRVDGESYSNHLAFWTGSAAIATNAERMRITSTGNVGIGSTVPNEKLTVADSGSANVYIALQNSTTGTTSADGWYLGAAGTEFQIYGKENGPITFSPNSTERARIDASGRLLVGTSSALTNVLIKGDLGSSAATTPQEQFALATNSYNAGLSITNYSASGYGGVLSLNSSKSNTLGANALVDNTIAVGTISFNGNDGTNFVPCAEIKAAVDGTPGANDMPGRLVFSTTADGASSPTERMRISNSGAVAIGDTSGATRLVVKGEETLSLFTNTTATTATFRTTMSLADGFGTERGSIKVSTTGTQFNTSSDYRLKENVLPVSDGITRLRQLKPSRFNFIGSADTVVDGFIAHEVQTVVPEAVAGTKDEIDAEGNPKYQGIDQSKLVPLLTAALQEAIAKIETLEARLTAAGIE
jgi:hypothetical protein